MQSLVDAIKAMDRTGCRKCYNNAFSLIKSHKRQIPLSHSTTAASFMRITTNEWGWPEPYICTVYLVISLPEIPFIHLTYMVSANPMSVYTYMVSANPMSVYT